MKRVLLIEQLEDRIAPATVINAGESFTFTDADGDDITIAYSGPDGSYIDATDDGGGDLGNNNDIGWLTVHGNDYTSAITVTTTGAGDGHIAITHGIQAADAGGNFGLISLGVDSGGAAAGIVDLSTGAEINVNGVLGGVVLSGDINFDGGGHKIIASGDIGLVEVLGNMTLSPTDHAYIQPGATYGASDVSFVVVEGTVYTQDGGGALAAMHLTSGQTSARIYDDYGTGGASGYLTAKVSGGTADIYAIPMKDGGYVVSKVEISDGASLAVTTFATGGDVGKVVSAGAVGAVSVSGAVDSDLYVVAGTNVGSVVNNTTSGDIVSVLASGTIGSITTKASGVFGNMLSGVSDAYPMLFTASTYQGWHTTATDIGLIKAGTIASTTIEASGSINAISALPGGITSADISAGVSITSVQAGRIDASDIFGQESIGTIKAGGSGITDSSISSHGDITLVQTPGAITASSIDAEYVVPGNISLGGHIGAVQAGSVFDSVLAARDGFGAITVKGQLATTEIDSEFVDSTGTVGGAISALTAGGMTGNGDPGNPSTVKAISIGTLSVGLAGITQAYDIDSHTTIAKVAVKGDVTNSAIINASTGIGTIAIGGDLAYDASIGSSGYLTSLAIKGQVLGGDVLVLGDVGTLSAKGGISGYGVTIGIGGNCTTFAVGGISGEDTLKAGEDASSVNIEIDGNVGKLAVAGGISSANIGIYGDAAAISVAGSIVKGGLLVEGDLTSLAVKGDLNHAGLTVGAQGTPVTVGKISIGGGMADCNTNYAVTIYGDVASLAVKGAMVANDMTLDGDLTAMSVGRGIHYTALTVTGSTGSVAVGSDVDGASMIFYDGITSCTVKGSISSSDVGTTHYDGGGNPLGGRIGSLVAGDITGASIYAYGGIGTIMSKGTIAGASIEAVGRDNNGVGSIVGGGDIGLISAKGLNGAEVLAYGSITSMTLGGEGVRGESAIGTVSATGNLGSLVTTGIIYGDITIAGNLTGSILSAGMDAVALGGTDLHFRDASGVITGGTLTVAGTIGGIVS